MIKKLIKLLLIFLTILILVISYFSFFGIETERFNNIIRTKIVELNKDLNIKLKSVNFLLNPLDLSIKVKTYSPEVIINNKDLKLEFIKTNISLKAFINNSFSIDDLQISTKSNKLSDIVALFRSFNNSTELFILEKIIKNGILVGDIRLKFDNFGKIKDDYVVNGFIKNAKLDFFKKYNFENLNLLFKIKDNEYLLEDIDTKFNQIKLSSKLIKVIQKKESFLFEGNIKSKEKDIDSVLLKKFYVNTLKNFDIENVNLKSDTDFKLNLSKKLKVSNLSYKSKINLNNLNYKKNLPNLNKYLPSFKELIKLQDHIISIDYTKNKLDISGKGDLIIEDKKDNLRYKISKINNDYIFDTSVVINKNSLIIDLLNYKKKKNTNSLLQLNGIYKDNKKIKFNSILLRENDNSFLIKNLSLNSKLKITNIDSIDLNYTNNKIKNQINLKRNKKNYIIKGKSFDTTKLINTLLSDDSNDQSSIFADLNAEVKIKIDKTYLDNVAFVNNLSANVKFLHNKIDKVNLVSNFEDDKKLTLSINSNDKNEKITTVFSSHPKPLLKQYKFIKGFEEGVLDFYSIKKEDVSNSVLTIDNFKVQEVPALAKLLTLASLQGIADLLTGEGIRFTDLEMKFSNQKGLMKIEEMYAIGPAISILMDGYIESKKLISLRGTLVPATTINRTIASIPLIGDFLVGKKTGEGIFGVSFKIKGPSDDLKTTVNPVKTLTPRFITRTLEKIKKN